METLSYNELRRECKAQGLSSRGKKVDLIARLKEHEEKRNEKESSSLKDAANVFANLLVAEREKKKKKEKKTSTKKTK